MNNEDKKMVKRLVGILAVAAVAGFAVGAADEILKIKRKDEEVGMDDTKLLELDTDGSNEQEQ